MKTSHFFSIGLFLCSIGASFAQLKPQPAPEKVVIDEYHGVKIEDPYRYLEDLKNPEVISWMKSQADYAKSKLHEIPERRAIIDKIKHYDKKNEGEIYLITVTESNHHFYLKRNTNEEFAKLYFRLGYDGVETLLFDSETYKKENGKKYDISGIYPTQKGDKVAIKVAPDGTEVNDILIIDTATKQPYSDIIAQTGGRISWLSEDKSFTYLRFNSSDITDPDYKLNTKVYLHKLGDNPNKDIDFFSNATNPELNIAPEQFAVIYYHKNSNKYYAAISNVDKRYILFRSEIDQNNQPKKWEQLVSLEDEIFDFNFGKDFFYLQSLKNASNTKIVKIPYTNLDFKNAITVIKEPKNGSITDFRVTRDGLYYSITENGIQAKVYYLANGKSTPKELKLPFQAGSASLSLINENKSEIWITLSGWISPTKRYLYNPASDSFTFQPLSKVVEYPEFKDIVSEEIMIPSHDDVKVPVSLIYNKNMKLEGNNPVFLYGYGAYGAVMEPNFSPETILNYVSYGGIFVVAHVRGGGELGDVWHKSGFKSSKPNTWKDFIATAEYLIKEKYTIPKKIAILGGSAGGILVGRSITERPDLFGVAIPLVGVMNPVRLEETPNGPGNTPEFGSTRDETEFKALLEMDSYHHIKKGTAYPATLITGGMNDPRVIAWQPSKFAAKLLNANTSTNSILFLTDFESGHGNGDSFSKYCEEIANIISFAYQNTGHPKFQLSKK